MKKWADARINEGEEHIGLSGPERASQPVELKERASKIVSHPEIFEFQDVIKIKNKTTFFS